MLGASGSPLVMSGLALSLMKPQGPPPTGGHHGEGNLELNLGVHLELEYRRAEVQMLSSAAAGETTASNSAVTTY